MRDYDDAAAVGVVALHVDDTCHVERNVVARCQSVRRSRRGQRDNFVFANFAFPLIELD